MHEIYDQSERFAQEDPFECEGEFDVPDTLLYWSLLDFADILQRDSHTC